MQVFYTLLNNSLTLWINLVTHHDKAYPFLITERVRKLVDDHYQHHLSPIYRCQQAFSSLQESYRSYIGALQHDIISEFQCGKDSANLAHIGPEVEQIIANVPTVLESMMNSTSMPLHSPGLQKDLHTACIATDPAFRSARRPLHRLQTPTDTRSLDRPYPRARLFGVRTQLLRQPPCDHQGWREHLRRIQGRQRGRRHRLAFRHVRNPHCKPLSHTPSRPALTFISIKSTPNPIYAPFLRYSLFTHLLPLACQLETTPGLSEPLINPQGTQFKPVDVGRIGGALGEVDPRSLYVLVTKGILAEQEGSDRRKPLDEARQALAAQINLEEHRDRWRASFLSSSIWPYVDARQATGRRRAVPKFFLSMVYTSHTPGMADTLKNGPYICSAFLGMCSEIHHLHETRSPSTWYYTALPREEHVSLITAYNTAPSPHPDLSLVAYYLKAVNLCMQSQPPENDLARLSIHAVVSKLAASQKGKDTLAGFGLDPSGRALETVFPPSSVEPQEGTENASEDAAEPSRKRARLNPPADKAMDLDAPESPPIASGSGGPPPASDLMDFLTLTPTSHPTLTVTGPTAMTDAESTNPLATDAEVDTLIARAWFSPSPHTPTHLPVSDLDEAFLSIVDSTAGNSSADAYYHQHFATPTPAPSVAESVHASTPVPVPPESQPAPVVSSPSEQVSNLSEEDQDTWSATPQAAGPEELDEEDTSQTPQWPFSPPIHPAPEPEEDVPEEEEHHATVEEDEIAEEEDGSTEEEEGSADPPSIASASNNALLEDNTDASEQGEPEDAIVEDEDATVEAEDAMVEDEEQEEHDDAMIQDEEEAPESPASPAPHVDLELMGTPPLEVNNSIDPFVVDDEEEAIEPDSTDIAQGVADIQHQAANLTINPPPSPPAAPAGSPDIEEIAGSPDIEEIFVAPDVEEILVAPSPPLSSLPPPSPLQASQGDLTPIALSPSELQTHPQAPRLPFFLIALPSCSS